jgi:transmembrane sensor
MAGVSDDKSGMADARAEAFDWFMRTRAEPDNTALQVAFTRWREEGEENRLACASVMRMFEVAKALPSDFAAAARRPRAAHRCWPSAWRRHRLLSRPLLASCGFAAAASVCLALYVLLREAPVPSMLHETAVAETREIVLDDGSTVFLDAETRVRATQSQEARTIELIGGQAYFDVASDRARPFVVETADLTITVTGTRFAVSTRGERIAVAVESGSVETVHAAATTSLSAGDRLSLHRLARTLERSSIDPTSVGAFRQGRVLVENVPFGELVEELDAYYHGDIWLGDASLAEQLVSGSFDLGVPVGALRAAAGTQDAAVREIGAGTLGVFSR